MALVPDYSPEEEEDAPGGSPGALVWGDRGGGGAPGGARQAEPSKQQDSGFVPWSRFVSANADVAKREAGELNDAVRGKVDAAQKAGDTAMDAFNNQVAGNYERAETPQQKGFADGKPKTEGAAASGFAAGKPIDRQPAVMGRGANVAAPTGNPNKPPPERPRLSYVAENTLAGPTADAVANGPRGSKDLESMLGGDAWGKLLGDTVEAEAESKALGSEGGVEALLQKQGGTPNSAFDAALINGAAGSSFGDTTKAGAELTDALGNRLAGSMNAWDRLTGDVSNARAQQSQDALLAKAAADKAAAGPGAPAIDGRQGVEGFGDPRDNPENYSNVPKWDDLWHYEHEDIVRSTGKFTDGLGLIWNQIGGAGRSPLDRVTDMLEGQGYAGVKSEDIHGKGNANDSRDLSVKKAVSDFMEEYGQSIGRQAWGYVNNDLYEQMLGMSEKDIFTTLEEIMRLYGLTEETASAQGSDALDEKATTGIVIPGLT